MSEIGALNSAMLGIYRGLRGARQNAADLASAKGLSGEPGPDTARSLVGLLENRTQVQASAQVVKAVDEAIGTLFDDKA